MTRKIWFDPAGYLRSALVPRVEPAPRLDSPTENTRSDRIRARSFLGYISLGVDLLLAKGRLTLGVTAHQWRQNLLTAGLIEIPVDGAIAARSVALTEFHSDPADRIVVATTLEDQHQLITDDRHILDWPGRLDRFPARRGPTSANV